MKHQIKHRYTNTVLFECDVPYDVQASGMAVRYTLEKAVKAANQLPVVRPPNYAGCMQGIRNCWRRCNGTRRRRCKWAAQPSTKTAN